MSVWGKELKTLIPEQMREGSKRTSEYLDGIGEWIDSPDGAQFKIDGLLKLLNPEEVDIRFIHHLAELTNLEISRFLGDDDYILRRQLTQAVDWYKIKGTYRSIAVIFYTVGLEAKVYDLYTSDYITFVRVPWIVGGIDELLDLGLNFDRGLRLDTGVHTDVFWKTPHFDIEINLSRFFGASPSWYLLADNRFIEAAFRVEYVRPTNTVPHYFALLEAKTDESGLPFTFPFSGVSAVVTSRWLRGILLFDQGLSLDELLVLDHNQEVFFDSVRKFRLGTGNRDVTLTAHTRLEIPVYSGDIHSKTVYADRIVFELRVPEEYVQLGISEVGLFNIDFSQMSAIATFPQVDKVSGFVFRILLTVWFGTVL